MKYYKYAIFAFLYGSGIIFLYLLFTPRRARILCYHRISNLPRDPLLDVSRKRFEEQVRYLAHHFDCTRLETIILRLRASQPLKRICTLTFDDGSNDWLSYALPILERFQTPATFFTTTGFIDNGSIPYPRPHAPATALTREEFQTLAASPLVTIGGHTVTHPHLSRISEDEMRNEIKQSKRTLEEWCGKTISLYAYPFGNASDYDETTKRIMREEGLLAGFSIEERTVTNDDDLFDLPRLVIFDEPLWMFKVRVSGIIDDAMWIFTKVKRSLLQ